MNSSAPRRHGKLTGLTQPKTFGWQMALLLAVGFGIAGMLLNL